MVPPRSSSTSTTSTRDSTSFKEKEEIPVNPDIVQSCPWHSSNSRSLPTAASTRDTHSPQIKLNCRPPPCKTRRFHSPSAATGFLLLLSALDSANLQSESLLHKQHSKKMSSIPHLSNAVHTRHLRQAIEREHRDNPGIGCSSTTGGTLHSLAETLKSVKIPIGIELSDKFISVNNKSITSWFTNRN